MSRKSNTEARRAEIVAAMLTVIARLGYEKATIQVIAKEANMAPGLIHYHFDTKQKILIALVKYIAEFSKMRFAEIAGDTDNPMSRLRAYLEARLSLGAGAAPEIVAAWVMIGAEAVHQPEVREVYQHNMAADLSELSELLRTCLVAQGRSTKKAGHLAAGLLAMIEGAFQLSSAASEVMPVGYAAGMAKTFAKLSIEAAPLAI